MVDRRWFIFSDKFEKISESNTMKLKINNYRPGSHNRFYSCSFYDQGHLITAFTSFSSESNSDEKNLRYHLLKVFNIKSLKKNTIHSYCLSKTGKEFLFDIVDSKIIPKDKSFMKIKNSEFLSCTIKNSKTKEHFNIVIEEYFSRVQEMNSRINIEFENNCRGFGCNIKFKCDKKFNEENPKFEFLWTKDGGELPKNSFSNGNYLKISKIKKINLGNYTCSILKNNQIKLNSSIIIYEQNGLIKHAFKKFQKLVNTEDLDERLQYLYRPNVLELGSNFAVECSDLYYDSFLPSWHLKKKHHNSIFFSVSPHILSFKNFSMKDLGNYVCRTKNKNGFLVELEIKIELDEFSDNLTIKNIGETVLNDKTQNRELIASKRSQIPNIRISFSDKEALANGERVQIFCSSDKKARIKWYKVNESGDIQELGTKENSITKSPIYNEDLGRYRCIASNQYGYRSRDAVLTRHNDSVEYFVYGFVDRYSEFSFENSGQSLSLYRSQKHQTNKLSLRIKKTYDKNNKLKFKCLSNFKRASLKWFIPGSHEIISSSYLSFNNNSDSGKFECIGNYKNQNAKLIFSAENKNGSIITRYHAFIYSFDKNFIRLDFLTQIQNISLNDRIEIACSSKQGSQTRWFHGKQEIKHSSLIIEKFSPKNLKVYKCKTIDESNLSISVRFKKISNDNFEGLVENSDRKLNNRLKKSSQKSELKIPDLNLSLLSPQKYFFKVGEGIILKCSTSSLIKDINIDWHQEKSFIDNGIKILELNRTQKILIFEHFEPTHVGIYTCSAKLKNSIFYEHENSIKVFILKSKFKDFFEIRVVYSKLTPNLDFKLNSVSTITSIECKNLDENLPAKWFKESKNIVQVFNQSNIEFETKEEAKYECSSENDFGISKISFIVKSSEIYWSEFSSSPKKLLSANEAELNLGENRVIKEFSKIGSQVILKCPSISDQIVWFKSGKKLSEERFKIESKNLLINRTQISDSGFYQCSTFDFKEFYTVELVLSEPIPILSENSYLQFNISNYLRKDKFSLGVSFKPFNLDGIVWSLFKNDEFISISLNNGFVYYESKQRKSVDVFVKIPKIVKLKKWNQLKIELDRQEVFFTLNDQNFKTNSDFDIKKIPQNLFIGSSNFQRTNFIGTVSSLYINENKINLINSAFDKKNIQVQETCSDSNCNKNETCVVIQNKVGFKCF